MFVRSSRRVGDEDYRTEAKGGALNALVAGIAKKQNSLLILWKEWCYKQRTLCRLRIHNSFTLGGTCREEAKKALNSIRNGAHAAFPLKPHVVSVSPAKMTGSKV